MTLDVLFKTINSLNNIGEKYATMLHKINIRLIVDLVFYLPSATINIKQNPLRNNINHSDLIACKVKIIDYDPIPSFKMRRTKPYRIYVATDFGDLTLIYFNYYPHYIIEKIQRASDSKLFFIMGKVDKYGNNIQIAHPNIFIEYSKIYKPSSAQLIYPLTRGISQNQMQKYIAAALKKFDQLDEWLSADTIAKNNWPSFKDAVFDIHNPETSFYMTSNNKARARLVYDELLAQQLTINLLRVHKDKYRGREFKFTGKLVRSVIAELGFNLTQGQVTALDDISRDQQSTKKMMRLIQGDVGSGKTLVALCAMLNVIDADAKIQCCFMAPTDILANQHFYTMQAMAKNIKFGLLTGKLTKKQKSILIDELKSGKINILIGTHALIQDYVEFNDLGLTIIDEQHKFGVKQRMALLEKGNQSDLLVMTATPIPRSLALALFGDMNISQIFDKPAGRKTIHTSITNINRLDEVTQSIVNKIDQGEQVYWVCPLIEKLDNDKNDNDSAAKTRFEYLTKILGDKVGLVHGKMKPLEKEANISKFASGITKLIVSTTVIEVGIDVPNATIIVIEQAENFGLAQLHQLRGRVGRGNIASYCILLYSKPIAQHAMARLKAMKLTNDGFALAERDMEIRGCGNIVGFKQSGLPNFKIANIIDDQELLKLAHQDAKIIIANDPELNSKKGLNLRNLLKIFGYSSKNILG